MNFFPAILTIIMCVSLYQCGEKKGLIFVGMSSFSLDTYRLPVLKLANTAMDFTWASSTVRYLKVFLSQFYISV